MRKTEIFTVTTPGRDKGKRFVLTEMPAMKAERWAYRALLALAHSGVELPDDYKSMGLQALAIAGLRALQGLEFGEAEPLLKEMMDCVQIMPDPANPGLVRPLQNNEMEGDDIEEVTTIIDIRKRLFALHTDFFLNEQT